jgi:hypothetical protein
MSSGVYSQFKLELVTLHLGVLTYRLAHTYQFFE